MATPTSYVTSPAFWWCFVRARLPDGAELTWSHDRLGRTIGSQTPMGAVQRIRRDLAGRMADLIEGDGTHRVFMRDGEGRTVRMREPHREFDLVWAELAQFVARRDTGIKTRFHCDLEERAVGITNAHDDRYSFERDRRGNVIAEVGWIGDRRERDRDAAGQICRLTHPSGSVVEYEWTRVGKLARVSYGDGSFERFEVLFGKAFVPDGK